MNTPMKQRAEAMSMPRVMWLMGLLMTVAVTVLSPALASPAQAKVSSGEQFQSRTNGGCLDGGGTQRVVYLYPENCNPNNENQQWDVTIEGLIRNKENYGCLDGGGTSNIVYLSRYCDSENVNQQWTFLSDGLIQNRGNGGCLDAGGTSKTLYLYPGCDANNPSHQWDRIGEGAVSVGYGVDADRNRATELAVDDAVSNARYEFPYGVAITCDRAAARETDAIRVPRTGGTGGGPSSIWIVDVEVPCRRG